MTRYNYWSAFPPPLTDEHLARYTVLVNDTPSPLGYPMHELLTVVRKWWNLPTSTGNGAARQHPVGIGTIIPLDKAIRDELVIPSPESLKAYAEMFGVLPPGEIRNAAHHLLAIAWELSLGREPITNDTLR